MQAATPPGINCIYIRQTEALGLGHAVLCAAPVVGDEPFAVILADDLIDAEVPVMRQMVERGGARGRVGDRRDGRSPPDDVGSYGIVETAARRAAARRRSRGSSRSRSPGTTPSTLAVVGRYVLTPRIFHHLRTMPPGAGGEIQLTDGIARLLGEEQVLAYAFEGRRYDCGSKLGYLEATVDFGLKHPELADDFARLPARARALHRMTLNELRYIVAVAQERNFGRAAQKCFVSQPALSVAIQKLEEELGARLFERGKSEVTRHAGRRAHRRAGAAGAGGGGADQEIAQAGRNQLVGHAEAGRHLHGRPVPAAGPHPGAARARAADAARHRGEPDREPRGRAEERAPRRGDHRAAVRAAGRDHRVPVRGAVPGRRAAGPQVGEAQVGARRTSWPASTRSCSTVGHCFRDQVLDACPELNRADAHVTRTSSLETVRNMVASGLGVSVLPRDALTPKYHSRLVVPVPFATPVPSRRVAIAWRKSFPRPEAIAAIRDAVAACRRASGAASLTPRRCAAVGCSATIGSRKSRRGRQKGVTLARNPLVHVVGDTGFEPVTPAV